MAHSQKPLLSILIATVSARNNNLRNLISILEPQLTKDVEVLIFWDNFETKLGTKRQTLLEAARGEYVCFIDDDDEVPPYYLDKILPLLDGVDYIGWRQQLVHNGEKTKPTFHSLRYPNVFDDDEGYYRNVSHLNPIKRSLALEGRFDRTSPEDHDWSIQVAHLPKSEHYIDDLMYVYYHNTDGSLWDKKNTPVAGAVPPDLPLGFSYIGASNGKS